jgi:aminopeptidase N
MLQPLFGQLGFSPAPTDNDNRRELRAAVLGALGTIADDPEVVRQSRAALDQALAGGPPLDPALTERIIQISVQQGDERLYDALAAAAARATSPVERNLYLLAPASFTDPRLIDRALQRALSSDVRTQDTSRYLAAFFEHPAARPRAWAFVKSNWNELEPKLRVFSSGARVVAALDAFCDSRTRDDIRSFFETHKLPGLAGAVNRTIDRINNCIDLREKQTKPVSDWLASRE